MNNNSCNNNSSCNNDHSIKLYNSVFNNVYLRKIIFYHLNIFNILLPMNMSFNTLQKFKHKQYLYKTFLNYIEDYDLNQLPVFIKHISFMPTKYIIEVPYHIESVSFSMPYNASDVNNLQKQPFLSKIRKLVVDCKDDVKNIQQIPESVTDLEIGFKGKGLSTFVLPSSLKKFSFSYLTFSKDEYISIESLREISISNTSPLIINQLSNCINLVNLKYRDLSGCKDIDSSIVFLDTLQHLTIQDCNTFSSTIPVNLKTLILSVKRFNYSIQLPPSLEHLFIKVNSGVLDMNLIKNLAPNLKSLELQCSSITYNNVQSVFVAPLEKLTICQFNILFQVNQLPSSLTHLDLGSKFNQIIDVNVLPANLNTLILGEDYSQVINPLAIPQHLKLLQIKNSDYDHPINLTPSTHPNTAITTNSDINLYYQATSSDYNQIRVLRLPRLFRSPLSTLQLQNKSNLEYLHLGHFFNHPIQLSDLPIQNNIKTLVLSCDFNRTVNLEHFQNLETIIVLNFLALGKPQIITTTTINEQKQIHYNNYKLKNIIVDPNHPNFIAQLDLNFYQFIKYSNNYNT